MPTPNLMLRHLSLPLIVAVALAACGRALDEPPEPSPTSPTVTETAEPTRERVAPPEPPREPYPRSGPATDTCLNGWRAPAEGSPLYNLPLQVIRNTTGVRGRLVVMHMRYFEGPESPPSDKGYLAIVRRWYVRAYAKDEPAFQARFLVESREFGDGLVAVAPYGTTGFSSPDWRGFQYNESALEPRPIRGLPGEWTGVAYDFVKGGAGLRIPGLPDAVEGCLDES